METEMDKLSVNLADNSYDILFSTDYSGLAEALENIGAPKRLLVVTDSNVAPLWLGEIKKLAENGYDIRECILDAGEENKNMDSILKICKSCLDNGLDRKSMILALGGGVVGDMAGFAAAIYMRGICFVQLPTTLLSQSDSSVGGKTGIDFMGAKNILGAFHQPALVYINTSVLKTLPEREFRSGMGEVIKHGIIRDGEFFDFLYDNCEKIKALDSDMLIKMAKTNCAIKAEVVAEDEKELGIRVILNFGHTIGHAIESAANFTRTHGECVAAGMCAASYIALNRGMIDNGIFDRIIDIINRYGFCTAAGADEREIIKYMKNDKKSIGGKLKFILPDGIGSVVQTLDVTSAEISAAIKFLG